MCAHSKRPGEINNSRLSGRVNWNTGIRVDADIASNINHDSTTATPIRSHESLSEQSSTDYTILKWQF